MKKYILVVCTESFAIAAKEVEQVNSIDYMYFKLTDQFYSNIQSQTEIEYDTCIINEFIKELKSVNSFDIGDDEDEDEDEDDFIECLLDYHKYEPLEIMPNCTDGYLSIRKFITYTLYEIGEPDYVEFKAERLEELKSMVDSTLAEITCLELH